jgi:Dyp-type peroxidase family
MSVSANDIKTPIDWKAPQFDAMLSDLQANILKGHGRPFTRKLFLTVKSGKAAAARMGLSAMKSLVTSAKQQLLDTEAFKAGNAAGKEVVLAFLSHEGYLALHAKPERIPTDPAFRAGMGARQSLLADPARTEWPGFAKVPHAMILIADASIALCKVTEAKVLATLGTNAWMLVHSETGQAIFDDMGRGLEHFGYMDGRSQPLMLTADVESERPAGGAAFKWDPAFGPDIALTKDRAGTGADSFGSYFVFRKLEQDVAGFRTAEKAIADARIKAAEDAGLPIPTDPKGLAEARELAGAMIVGRFEDGTPVMEHGEAKNAPKPPNDFSYSEQDSERKCPRHAHIRKTNPRDGTERRRIMARRGITYGGLEGSGADVGLLFMAYSVDIARQFEFTQASWANNAGFPVGDTGIDPIIGQGQVRRPPYTKCPIAHGDPNTHQGDFQQFVTMRGGEYFFAPSRSGLANLA